MGLCKGDTDGRAENPFAEKITPRRKEIEVKKGVLGMDEPFWRFLGACQEYILDKKAPDTRFDQCLQGFRDLKKAATMACTNSAFCAKIAK
jgi:hypothetical protein